MYYRSFLLVGLFHIAFGQIILQNGQCESNNILQNNLYGNQLGAPTYANLPAYASCNRAAIGQPVISEIVPNLSLGEGDISVTGDLPIGGTIKVCGSFPVYGVVAVEGNLPTFGTAVVNTGCGFVPQVEQGCRCNQIL